MDVEDGDDWIVRLQHRPLIHKPFPDDPTLSPVFPGCPDFGVGQPNRGCPQSGFFLCHLSLGNPIFRFFCLKLGSRIIEFRLRYDLLLAKSLGSVILASSDAQIATPFYDVRSRNLEFCPGLVNLLFVLIIIKDCD